MVQPPAELSHESFASFQDGLEKIKALALDRQTDLHSIPTIAKAAAIQEGLQSLPTRLPNEGDQLGLEKTLDLLFTTIIPTLASGQAGPRYFGFVTGGTLPSALLTDMVVSILDANVQVHLPKETLSTVIEQHALTMVKQLLNLDLHVWTGTFTTGATASNLLALASARQSVLQRIVQKKRSQEGQEQGGALGVPLPAWDPAEDGIGGEDSPRCKVFVCQAHASIKKTAAILAIGRKNVIDVGKSTNSTLAGDIPSHGDADYISAAAATLEFDLVALEDALRQCKQLGEGAIVVVGMGEVMTGALTDQTPALASLCKTYDAWLHMDAAFSAFVCLHKEFDWISAHMNLCDSITSDGHKTLNVPYDNGILLIKKQSSLNGEQEIFLSDNPRDFAADHNSLLDEICSPMKPGSVAGPSYLSGSTFATLPDGAGESDIIASSLPSPLNRNLENSRRFRALPVYISLLSQGRTGTREMVERQLAFAARVRSWMRACSYYEVLTPRGALDRSEVQNEDAQKKWTHGFWATTVVLFRAHPQNCPIPAFRASHLRLMEAIKSTRQIYVSPCVYAGMGALRIAVSNWCTGLGGENGSESDFDFDVTTKTLLQVMQQPYE